MFKKELIAILIITTIIFSSVFIGLEQKCSAQCPTTLCYQSCCNSNGPGRHSCGMGALNNVGTCTCNDGSTIPCICGSSGPNCMPIGSPSPSGTPNCANACSPSTGNYQITRCAADKDQLDMYIGGYCCCDRTLTPVPSLSPPLFPSPSTSPSTSSSPSLSPSPCRGCGFLNDPPGTIICGSEPGSLLECGSASCSFYPIGNCPSGNICVGDPSGLCPSGYSCFSGSVHCEPSNSPSSQNESETLNEMPSSFDTMYP